MEVAIEANELTKTYGPGVTALDGLSLPSTPGTIVRPARARTAPASRRPSRSSRRSSRPDSGSARVAGIDVLADPVRVRHAIGVVAQKHGVDPEATGRENLVLQGQFYGITGRRAQAARRRSCSSASAWPTRPTARRRRTRAACSAGSTSRSGLLHRPQVLFLDEPTTGLDPEARAEMWREIEPARDARSR